MYVRASTSKLRVEYTLYSNVTAAFSEDSRWPACKLIEQKSSSWPHFEQSVTLKTSINVFASDCCFSEPFADCLINWLFRRMTEWAFGWSNFRFHDFTESDDGDFWSHFFYTLAKTLQNNRCFGNENLGKYCTFPLFLMLPKALQLLFKPMEMQHHWKCQLAVSLFMNQPTKFP